MPDLKGTEASMYNVPCIFNKQLYFLYHMAGYFLDRPYVYRILLQKIITQKTNTEKKKIAIICNLTT